MRRLKKSLKGRISRLIHNIKIGRHNLHADKLVRYLVTGDWSTRHDGECLMASLRDDLGEITTSHYGIHQGILHFGGITAALYRRKIRWPSQRAICGLTWFHVLDNDQRLSLVPKLNKRLAFWHTSCQSTADILIRHGADPEKMHVIPLGVDPTIFKPLSAQAKRSARQALDIPDDVIVVGSFQRDGYLWNDRPKLEKGPDVFCDVVEKLAAKHKILVLLSGPARGYVMHRLDAAGIAYRYSGYLDHANDVAPYFQVLDLYLIASRIEGGPKAILEAPACGIPLVTTRVGMAPDIIQHGKNGLLADVEDVETLYQLCCRVIEEPVLAETLARNGRRLAEQHAWRKIAERYYNELYLPLLQPVPAIACS